MSSVVRQAGVPFLLMLVWQTVGLAQQDRHRPPCNSTRCKTIEQFLKQHYCGKSPYGNGPDNGCDILDPNPGKAVDAIADFACNWSPAQDKSVCQRHGKPPASIRTSVVRELRRLGLPTTDNDIYFRVWKPRSADWWVAEGDYSHSLGARFTICQVVILVDTQGRVRVLRKLPFQSADIDVPKVTTWSLLGLADTDGDGQLDVILRGDAYEDHWLEVITPNRQSRPTLFSGLGYYL
jgi:hypothetical protein